MKSLVMVLLLLPLLSCSSRYEVHIFNQGYSPQEISRVAEALEDLGFKASTNHLDVPPQIPRTSIIYPPIVQDFASVDIVQDALLDIGFSHIELIQETEGEHYYSSDNIGLYLVNPDYVPPVDSEVEQNPEAFLSRIYYSNCEDLEAELGLFPAGAAILEVFDWKESIDSEITSVRDGEWKATKTDLEFSLFEGGKMVFNVSEFDGRDNYGRFFGIDLDVSSNTTGLQSCDFRYITYDVKETLNRI